MELLEGTEFRDWVEWAACRNSKVDFFPTFNGGKFVGKSHATVIQMQREIAREALKICLICPVKSKCEEDHRHEKDGVFYGTVPAERGLRNGRIPRKVCNCIPCNEPVRRFK